MAFYTGRSGSLVFNGKPVAKIRDWSLDTTVELLSTDTIDSFAKSYTPGIKSSSGKATLMYYRLEVGESATYTEFTALLGKIHKTGAISTADRVLLKLNAGGGVGDDIQFYAYITSATVSATTGELSTVPIQFTVDGDFLADSTIV
jgi:hypothetical protein